MAAMPNQGTMLLEDEKTRLLEAIAIFARKCHGDHSGRSRSEVWRNDAVLRKSYANRRASPLPNRLATQRPHRPSCSAWLPTSAR